jgi:hypothetical protein
MKTMFIITDGSYDTHAVATTRAKAERWIAKAKKTTLKTSTFFIHEVEFAG